ncbi:MAG TPA: hypothetical protein VHE81_10585 [Lacipirellulaceae bacterium]|nr:hypothetical protein [Lacipirellulaceae bacterium]
MKYSVLLISFFVAQTVFAAHHPGNVFTAGEDVSVAVPKAWSGWRAIDISRNELAHGSAQGGVAELGKLPTGYFEVHEKDGPGMITAAVLTPTTIADDTPIAIDAGMSWFYPDDPQKIRDACSLCRLGGVKWVRDRASWPEIETARGTWAGETRYERTMRIEHEEGLKILQVNHISPAWASKDPRHFPDDLRDVYNFYRGLAKRWKGLADAIEPWNEPDIAPFGAHTGCEIGSFQKAAYLGLKAGNPELPVNQAVFAIDRAATLNEFGKNEVYPYFDRYDLHHYVKLPLYPRAYARHRAVSGGRPMWTTEFNLTIWWSDEKTGEPSEDDLRVQAFRVSKVFSEALYEGPVKLFYFMLGHYVERQLQYGIVHTDLTPRPAYVAFAAVGRFLDAAKPIGRVDLGDEKLKGYVFATKVDGSNRETLVTWSETKPTTVKIPPAEKAYDYLGRDMTHARKLKLTREPIFVLLPPGGSKQLKIIPPPAKAKWLVGQASPVVLQLVGKGNAKQSAFQVDSKNTLQLVAYNFGDKPARGKLSVAGATGAKPDIEIAPGAREVQLIQPDGSKNVTARLDAGALGHAIVAANVNVR